jgi:exonuclease SbcD
MKIVHTSDWHLGRRLEGESLFEPHEHFLTWLVEDLIPREKPDLLVIAGDIFDRPVPPTEAIELYEKSLAKISKLGVRILISAGNHDNRVRLGMHSGFLEEMGVHFRTRLHQVADPVRIESEDFVLLAYAIPYLEPDVDAGVNAHQWDVEPTTSAVMSEAIRKIRVDVDQRRKDEEKPVRTLVASHAWVTGGSGSESERNVKVGTLGQASADLFAGIDYVAMGHLHGPQQVKSTESLIFYSGSPIPFSFSERDHQKRVLVLEVGPDGVKEDDIKSHAVPQVRKMQQFRDNVEALLSDQYPETDDWVKVIVTDEKVPVGFFEILKNRKFKYLLQMIPEKSIDGIVNRSGEGVLLQNLTHEDVTKRFIKRVTRSEELDSEMTSAIEECCHEVEQNSVSI